MAEFKTEKEFMDWVNNMPDIGGIRGKLIAQYREAQEKKKTQDKLDQRYSDITDFNSPYYQEYRKFLQDTTPQLGVNSLISPLLAGGAGFSGAQKIAQERAQAFTQQRQQGINQGVKGFALESQGQGNSILGMDLQNKQFYAGLNEQKRQFNESQPTFWDSLLNVGGGLLGNYLGGGFGGAVGGGMASGGINAAMTGQPIGKGMVSGGVGAGLGSGIQGFNPAQYAGIESPTLANMFNRGAGSTMASLAQGQPLSSALKTGVTNAGISGVNSVGRDVSDFFKTTYDSLFSSPGTQADFSYSDNPAMNASFGSNYNAPGMETLRSAGMFPQQSNVPPTSSNFTDINSIGLPSLSMNPAENASYGSGGYRPPGADVMQEAGLQPGMSYAPPGQGGQTSIQDFFAPNGSAQEQTQKTAQGTSVPAMFSNIGSSLGNYALNNAGDLAAMLYGFYNNRKQQKQIGSQMQSLKDLYAGNSPYAQQLRAKLQASAAQRGTRSNTAGREVQLQAALADRAAQTMPTQFAMQQYQDQLKNRNMSNLLNMGNQSGLFKMAGQGLQSLFGQPTQEIPYNFGNVSGSDMFGYKGAGGF